ncbi:hypothetical protein KLEP7_gp97 [Pseudaeromonas phage vB_PpeM_ KLEP7]|nr:hypothetical protein KLEP7_gp97 [Pseudaeromonas phage vB_PpeM_ KLEP7]
MNKDLDIGDRVLFDPSVSRWDIGSPSNPIETLGTVNGIDYWITVDWDNGEWNEYNPNDEDLILVKE